MQLAWRQTSPSGQPMTPMVPSGTSQRLLVVVMLMCDRSCRESSQHWMRCSTETSMFLCYTRTLDWMSFKKNFHVIFFVLFYATNSQFNCILCFIYNSYFARSFFICIELVLISRFSRHFVDMSQRTWHWFYLRVLLRISKTTFAWTPF